MESNKEKKIRLKSIFGQDGITETGEQILESRIAAISEGAALSFDERGEEGEHTHTLIKIRKKDGQESVYVKRRGTVTSEMLLVVGDVTKMDYRTPVGTLRFFVETKEIKTGRDPFFLDVSYKLFHGDDLSTPVSENRLIIEEI